MTSQDRTFTIKKNDTETFEVVLKAPPLSAQGLRFATWGSAYVLANLLHKLNLPQEITHRWRDGQFSPSILELGAGTGLAGISAVTILDSSVMLTDLDEVLDGIDANIELNRGLRAEYGASITCNHLDWTTPQGIIMGRYDPSDPNIPGNFILDADTHGNFNLILAADTLYSEEQPEILVNTMQIWSAKNSNSRVVVCYALRVAYIDVIREFWERMADAGFDCEQEGQEELSEQDGFDDEKLYEWCVWKWRGEDG